MKKFFLCCLSLLCVATLCFAQTLDTKDFEQKFNDLYSKMTDAAGQKSYPKAEQYCLQMLKLFEDVPQSEQSKYGDSKLNQHYNLACMQSLQGKRKAAVKNFELVCGLGYDDYIHVLNDSDLDNIRGDKTFQRLHEAMRGTSDYTYILQQSAEYNRAGQTDSLPHFRYQAPNDRNLVRVREYFKLDSVAGAGAEISKIKNILTFIHNTILHDGQHNNPTSQNAIDMAEVCKDGSRGLNCRGLATVLNECYLAMGFKSRFVTCMPKVYIHDCHVINAVYSATLDKWIWVDPTNNAWINDENGAILSVQEVRERLRDGRTLLLNEDANWNNRQKQTKEEYLDNYMAKNLYCIVCSDRSEFNMETHYEGKIYPKYTILCPQGFTPDYPMMKLNYTTNDDAWFWQSPYNE